MKKKHGLLVIGLFCNQWLLAQDLQTVTNNGATTTNALKITGAVNIPNGLGLELYYTNSTSVITSNDRTNGNYYPMGFYASKFYFSDGSVGVGTLSPTSKLDVNGLITSTGNSTAGMTPVTNISALSGYKISGNIANLAQNGITFTSGFGGGAAIGFYRGSSYNTGIDFYTNTTANASAGGMIHRMRLNEQGNLGLGTTTPVYKIHSYAAANTTIASALIAGEYFGPIIGVKSSTSSYYALNVVNNLLQPEVNGQGTSLLYVRADGNVGIGTSTPANKLYVNGNMGISGPIYMPGGTLYSDVNNMASLHNGGFVWANTANTTSKMVLGSDATLSLYGNMYIGTTNNQKDLNVNGKIKTRKVTVTQTNWPDYVFDSSYQLKPLHQVEKFITANKHLPEVPSAATVAKEGIDLGDNQVVLLKKIEELTLYIIQQNKRIESLEQQMQTMKAGSKQ
ncbi:hypothetical protein HNQ91_005009 [Filimonas zeae]|uniref:Peptidase S74 domain-containing protein n=1 Tax=Filimonas zeae TaxID=1737353 RepID=A0A917J390_9BACT|nr:hypothetical protein [Filimonas zeae]MDR6341932.1 hypothetical protein [Filimonas zeae]GGH79770.1 hypothetical protein GCM10011379_49640 [Filimonas zeae]